MSTTEERISKIEVQVGQIISSLRVLQKWVTVQEGITSDDTILFDNLDKRVKVLEDKEVQREEITQK